MGRQTLEATSPAERIRALLFPERIYGWRAVLLVVGIVSGVLLASSLLWLGIAPPTTSWKLIAFSAMFFSLCLWALAPLVPKRFCRIVAGTGMAALAASVIWVQFALGA